MYHVSSNIRLQFTKKPSMILLIKIRNWLVLPNGLYAFLYFLLCIQLQTIVQPMTLRETQSIDSHTTARAQS